VSALTKHAPFGAGTPFAIPHWFYSELARGETPHICQIVALSRIIGVPLVECMAAFGYELDDIPRLQMSLANVRPAFVNVTTYGQRAERLELTQPATTLWERTAPLSELASPGIDSASSVAENADRYAYVKTSENDSSLYPVVGSGSLLRIDRTQTRLGTTGHAHRLFAVEWRPGLTITFLTPATGTPGLVVLPPQFPALEQKIGTDIMILGAVDVELRSLEDRPAPAPRAARVRSPRRVLPNGSHGVGAFLKRARERVGLNYREAHEMTVQLSALKRDPAYAISQSTLFDYELRAALPRHVPRIISVCSVYGLTLWDVLDAAGVAVERDGETRSESAATDFPLFLRAAIPALLRHDAFSLDDVYVCGSRLRALTPYLHRALYLVIDRHERSIERANARAKFRRPMFLVRTPSDDYATGFCSLHRGVLTVQPSLQRPTMIARFASRDAEVVGRIAGVVRLLTQT
jgi:hypothetical protein